MAILSIPDQGVQLNDPVQIKSFLDQYKVFFDQWHCAVQFEDTATQEDILAAYAADLQPFMARQVLTGY